MKPINNYQVPHPLDRKDQQSTIDEILASDAQYLIVEAPTGSGKSAWAAYAGKFYRTMVGTETKSLQYQYENGYGFTVSVGRGNFECDEIAVNAEQCPLSRCNDGCPYKRSRKAAIMSDRVAINYKKYTLDHKLVTQHNTDILFLDEAHLLPDIVMDNSGLSLPWRHRFINADPIIVPPGSHPVSVKNGIVALRYMLDCVRENEVPWNEGNEPKSRDRIQWERLGTRIHTTLAYVLSSSNTGSWYFDGSDGENLIVRPLTAKFNFSRMFDSAKKTVLMSATPGNHAVLARSLGIQDNYEYIGIKGEFGPEDRPVYDLRSPKIRFTSPDSAYFEQAQVISNALHALDHDYTGILHTKSKKHARLLKKMLEKQSNISKYYYIVPDNVNGTENQAAWWEGVRHPGAALIHWAFWEGVDLGEDNFSIVCKTPFPPATPGYAKAKMDYDPYLYRQQAANYAEQACGRVRRGFDDHYGPNAKKFVAIADGNWTMVKSSYSNSFLQSIKVFE